MDPRPPPASSLRSGPNHPESEGDAEQYYSHDDEESAGDIAGEPSRKRRRPMSVS